MIASVRGVVLERGLDHAVIEMGGVGMLIYATANALADLQEGEQARLYTQLIVREDALTLYGFSTTDERSVFNALIGVSRFGPKIALAALGALGADGIRRAVQDKDQSALTRIPGVGSKSAQRLLVELSGRLTPVDPSGGVTAIVSRSGNETVIAALVQLGWKDSQAQAAVAQVDPQLPTAQALRAALALLGGRNV